MNLNPPKNRKIFKNHEVKFIQHEFFKENDFENYIKFFEIETEIFTDHWEDEGNEKYDESMI